MVSRRDQRQLWLVSLDGQHRRFREIPASVHSPRFSPDGRTLAFVSEESGRGRGVRRRPDGSGAARRLSRSGGMLPRFRADGRELFYFQHDGMLVSVDPAPRGAPPPRCSASTASSGVRLRLRGLGRRPALPGPLVPRARGLAGPAPRARLDARAGRRTRDALIRVVAPCGLAPGRVRRGSSTVQNLKRAVRPNVRGWLVR